MGLYFPSAAAIGALLLSVGTNVWQALTGAGELATDACILLAAANANQACSACAPCNPCSEPVSIWTGGFGVGACSGLLFGLFVAFKLGFSPTPIPAAVYAPASAQSPSVFDVDWISPAPTHSVRKGKQRGALANFAISADVL